MTGLYTGYAGKTTGIILGIQVAGLTVVFLRGNDCAFLLGNSVQSGEIVWNGLNSP